MYIDCTIYWKCKHLGIATMGCTYCAPNNIISRDDPILRARIKKANQNLRRDSAVCMQWVASFLY